MLLVAWAPVHECWAVFKVGVVVLVTSMSWQAGVKYFNPGMAFRALRGVKNVARTPSSLTPRVNKFKSTCSGAC